MKKRNYFFSIILLGLLFVSCKKETRDKLKKAKETISNTSTMVKDANTVKDNIEKLQKATPLTNAQLKTWLPEQLKGMQRKSFKVGASQYANIASIEGKYDTPNVPTHIEDDEGKRMVNPLKKSFSIQLYDGAGPMGGMMITGLGMAAKMDFEEESEFEHKKTVVVRGVKALQTVKKPRTPNTPYKVQIQFVFNERFGVMVNSASMNVEEVWNTIQDLDLESLSKEASS